MEEDNQNEEEGIQSGQEMMPSQPQMPQQEQRDNAATSMAKKQINKKVQDKATKAAANAAAKKGVTMALSHILVYVIIFIIAIVVLVGIAMFFVTMPGMVMDKLKKLAKVVGSKWAAWFGTPEYKQVDRKEIYEVMDYVEQMGYSLKEHGYLTHYLDENNKASDGKVYLNVNNGNTENELTSEDFDAENDTAELDKEQGVYRSGESGKIIAGCSEFITQYIISDNYLYTIRNFTVDTNGNGWIAVFDHIRALFNTSLSNRSGMISLLHDNGIGTVSTNIFGNEDTYDAREKGYIKIDPNSKKLHIKKGWISAVEIEYDLEGWTGRYGMPLEFLLSVHSATMMPDLAYDMANSFDTDVRILLHKSANNKVKANYKGANGYISQDQVKKVTNEHIFDDWNFSASEAGELINLGMVPPGHNPPSCGCTYKRTFELDGQTYEIEHGDYKEYPYDNMGNPLPPIEHTDEDYYFGLNSLGNLAYLPIPEGVEIIEDRDSLSASGDCYNYVKKAIQAMKQQTVSSFTTYSPYIESVRNHWYRDVYFVVNSNTPQNFIKYDYEYENLMKERWTEYEVWGDDDTETLPDEALRGRYKLYKVTIGNDGSYSESSTPETNVDAYVAYEQSRNQGDDVTRYVKKAKTVNLPSEYDDLYWNDMGNGTFSAYDVEMGQESSMEPMYDEEDINKESDPQKQDAMRKMYAELTMNVVKQTGDGLRTETNETIKKMFLANKYFRYDGSSERAEEITLLRETYGIPYGKLDKDTLEKQILYTNKDGVSQNIKVKDVAGTVQITQDSINAFSMLENTHTLDADYIYRDFKELIVELGFFTKEELSEAIPQILEFPVPELGTYGYPIRVLDKKENEKGTLIHSKKDYEAYYSMSMGIKEDIKERKGEGAETSLPPENMHSGLDKTAQLEMLATDLTNVSGTSSSSAQITNAAQFKQDTWLGTVQACWEYLVKENHRLNGGITYADGGTSPMPFAETPSERKSSGDMIDCSGFTCWCLYCYFKESRPEVAEHFSQQICTGDMVNENYTEMFGLEEIPIGAGEDARPKLKPGDILVRWNGDGATHHVCIVKEPQSDGSVWTYDCGSQSHWNTMDNLDHTQTRETFVGVCPAPGKIIRIENTKKDPDFYEGYQGNEAVVSPVTGILLEYGRYNDDSINKYTKKLEDGTQTEEVLEELRENSDLNGTISSLIKDSTKEGSDNVSSQRTEDVEEAAKVVDKVGYAKILVLDGKHLSTLIESSSTWDRDKLLTINTSTGTENYHDELLTKQEDMKPWDTKQTTVYGFKEFAESYYKYGIAGFVIYMDGFVCELPEEVEPPEDAKNEKDAKKDNYKTFFHGEELTFEDFKKASIGNLTDDTETKIASNYSADDAHQFSSKKVTERVAAESSAKQSAFTSFTAGNYCFIKEGTVLGRTMSDIEANSVEINNHPNRKNNDPSHDFKYYRPKYEQDEDDADDEEPVVNWQGSEYEYTGDRVIGNYLRVIMLDQNSEIVENVEDYMKLDPLIMKNQDLGMEKFLFWMGCLAEGGHIVYQNGTWYSKAIYDGVGTSSEPGQGWTHFFGLTNYDMDQYEKATGRREWTEYMKLEDLVNTYLIMIDEDIDWVKETLGDDIPDGYLQGFISLAHNFGKVYPHPPPHDDFNWRADEYLATGQVSEETWARDYSYSSRPEMDREMEKRRRNEWAICSKGIYPEPYSDDHDTEYDWSSYQNNECSGVTFNISEETPFSDWCDALGIQITAELKNIPQMSNSSGSNGGN